MAEDYDEEFPLLAAEDAEINFVQLLMGAHSEELPLCDGLNVEISL
jgi:hypothetical protein